MLTVKCVFKYLLLNPNLFLHTFGNDKTGESGRYKEDDWKMHMALEFTDNSGEL